MFIKDMSVMVDGQGTITVTDLTDGRFYQIRNDHPAYEEILKVKNREAFLTLLNPPKAVADAVEKDKSGEFTVCGDVVHYKRRPLHKVLSDRLLTLMRYHMDEALESMKKFIDNLLQNPSNRSVEQIYSFLQHSNLGLTDDGHFIAYKVVRDNYLDKHTGTISNRPGESPSMERNLISDDPNSACSRGLHVGSLRYAGPGGSFYSKVGDRCVMVKVNPRDVVCVPYDASSQKVRVCQYTVLADVTDVLQDDRLYDESGRMKEARVTANQDEEDFYVYAEDGERVNPVKSAIDTLCDDEYYCDTY